MLGKLGVNRRNILAVRVEGHFEFSDYSLAIIVGVLGGHSQPLKRTSTVDTYLFATRLKNTARLKKSVVVQAVQWFKHGDHPAVLAKSARDTAGYINTPEGRLRVEVGDWVITDIAGENYPCKPDIFDKLYTAAD